MGNNPGAVLVLCFWIVTTAWAALRTETEVSSSNLSSEEDVEGHVGIPGHMRRRLLIEDNVSYSTTMSPKGSNHSTSGNQTSRKSSVVVGVLLTVTLVASFILVVIKCRVFRRFFGGGREGLLPEEETASQFSHPGTLTDTRYSMRGREAYADGEDNEEDDDGFIEDNYITSSEKGRTEPEGGHQEILVETSDDELDINFSIE